jgi:hypothetical protein
MDKPLSQIRCHEYSCLAKGCLVMDVYSDFTIPAFRRHVTIFILRYCLIIRRGHVNIYLVLSKFIYTATLLLTFNGVSVLYFVVFSSPNKFTST